MDFIISLAHFCEVHGPTVVLCTQLTPLSCANCFPTSTPLSEYGSKNSSFSSGFFEPPTSPGFVNALTSPFDSPPTSPRSDNSYTPYFGGSGSSYGSRGSFSRDSFTSDSDNESCDNCTFVVPKDMSQQLPEGVPGSPTKDGKGYHGTPTLRTTQPIVAYSPEPEAADAPESEEESEEAHPDATDIPGEDEIADPLHDASPDSTASAPRSAGSSRSCKSYNSSHCHTLQYLTSRQPISSLAYSRLRRACIRTLSWEKLPRGSHSGPIYFGDPVAGYTIAYIFRLKDPRARGRLRHYALIALGGRDGWRVSKAHVVITKAFESIANQITDMANAVLEKEAAASAALHSPRASISSIPEPKTPPLSSSLPSPTSTATPPLSPDKDRAKSANTSPVATRTKVSDVSSFLSAKKVDPDGYPRVSREVMRAKGLAEIVGKDSFFVELHARFCLILAGLVKEYASSR